VTLFQLSASISNDENTAMKHEKKKKIRPHEQNASEITCAS
jgi:hypothetical protein